MKIAMWSGPRNLSTAMMYSFGARADFDVMDEPFYAAYLSLTELNHPMRDEILASMETDPVSVSLQMQAHKRPNLYVKHMTHHMIPAMDRDWFGQFKHAFLIRHPARVVASYHAKREHPDLMDIGFIQQAEIFEQVQNLGLNPVVVDSFDVRAKPESTLTKLCSALDLVWDPAMLSWPKGGHRSDGIWAAHWYGSVHNSTGFAEPEGELPELEPHLQKIADAALPHYEALTAFKI